MAGIPQQHLANYCNSHKDNLHDMYTEQLPCIQLQQVNIEVKLCVRLQDYNSGL